MEKLRKGTFIIIAVRFVICLIGLIVGIIYLSGCISLSVNQEKDLDTTVAVIGGTKYAKRDFLGYFNTYLLHLEVGGDDLPSDDAEISAQKMTAYNSWVLANAIRTDLKGLAEDPLNQDDVQEDYDNFIRSAKAFYSSPAPDGTDEPDDPVSDELPAEETEEEAEPDDAAYTAALVKYFGSEEDAEKNIRDFYELDNYTQCYVESSSSSITAFRDESVATINGKDIKRSLLYFFLVYDTLYQQETTAQTFEEKSAQTMELIARSQVYLDLAEAEGFVITEDDKSASLSEFTEMEAEYEAYGLLNYFRQNYYLDRASYAEGRDYLAQVMVVYDKIEEIFQSTEPDDNELKSFYALYKPYFQMAKASWMTTSDDTIAAAILDEAGGTKEGYLAVYEKYKDDEAVTAHEFEDYYYSDVDASLVSALFEASDGTVAIYRDNSLQSHIYYIEAKDIFTLESNREKAAAVYHNSQEAMDIFVDNIWENAAKKTYDYKLSPEQAAEAVLRKLYNIKTYPSAAIR